MKYCTPDKVFHNDRCLFDKRLRTNHIQNKINQRTSGPVNAHLTPGPGIDFKAFIRVYSPRAGTDNP